MQLSLAARVADAYFLLIEQRSQLQLADQSIEAYSQSLDMVERRYRGGLVPAVDFYLARQNLASAQAIRESNDSAMKMAEHALAILIGRYPGDEVAGQLVRLPSPPESFPAGLPSELLTRRPDLRAALLRVKANDERVAVAIADRFPVSIYSEAMGPGATLFRSRRSVVNSGAWPRVWRSRSLMAADDGLKLIVNRRWLPRVWPATGRRC